MVIRATLTSWSIRKNQMVDDVLPEIQHNERVREGIRHRERALQTKVWARSLTFPSVQN